MIGPNYFRRGAMALLTPEGRNFIHENMPSIARRSGSEPDISDSVKNGHPIAEVVLGKHSLVNRGITTASDIGTYPIRTIDAVHNMTTAIGAYQRELAKLGIDPDTYATTPVVPDALNKAMAIARRTVASTLPEDMPQVLSRGKFMSGKSGNISSMKTLFHFGNTYLDIFSVIAHDFAGGSVKAIRGRDLNAAPFLGALGLAIAASVIWETGIRFYGRELINQESGKKQSKDEKTFNEELEHELLKRFPFMGNAMSAKYNRSGVPVMDAIITASSNAYKLAHGTGQYGVPKTEAGKEKTFERNRFETGVSIATLLGIPATSIASRLARPTATGQTGKREGSGLPTVDMPTPYR